MPDTREHLALTHEGAAKILAAAVSKAAEIEAPQCVAVTDDGGHLLAFARMDGAKVLSVDSAIAKARTAASSRRPTGDLSDELERRLAFATQGKLTNLLGGLPIVVEGHVIGAIGVGSGTGEQDVEVARAGVATLAGAQSW
ncbi:MAG: GlcG/HbpS family heme-binding protein [Actinomycetota bacterium]